MDTGGEGGGDGKNEKSREEDTRREGEKYGRERYGRGEVREVDGRDEEERYGRGEGREVDGRDEEESEVQGCEEGGRERGRKRENYAA